MSEDTFSFVAACLMVAFALIMLMKSCTSIVVGGQETTRMTNCVGAGFEWRDGDCVKGDRQ